LQAGRDIDGITQHREVCDCAFPDIADEGFSRSNACADLQTFTSRFAIYFPEDP